MKDREIIDSLQSGQNFVVVSAYPFTLLFQKILKMVIYDKAIASVKHTGVNRKYNLLGAKSYGLIVKGG